MSLKYNQIKEGKNGKNTQLKQKSINDVSIRKMLHPVTLHRVNLP